MIGEYDKLSLGTDGITSSLAGAMSHELGRYEIIKYENKPDLRYYIKIRWSFHSHFFNSVNLADFHNNNRKRQLAFIWNLE